MWHSNPESQDKYFPVQQINCQVSVRADCYPYYIFHLSTLLPLCTYISIHGCYYEQSNNFLDQTMFVLYHM